MTANPGRLATDVLLQASGIFERLGITEPEPYVLAVAGLAGADELADRLRRAVADEVKLLALTIDERAIILNALDDAPNGPAELRGVLVNQFEWHKREGLHSPVPSVDRDD